MRAVDETRVVAHINGELVVWDAAGRLAFERLQNRLAQRGAGAAQEWPAHFVAFDLLRLSGTDTTSWPYAEIPPRVEYALPRLGEELRKVLEAMGAWAMAVPDPESVVTA
ncbi:hypothetical protein QFZ76_004530 [Streptomyces sp. V4I2]|nr:hypothetical protein [Streptomyces sp. V4I2]